jgi:nucleotide-binding universal stress UspA family protein
MINLKKILYPTDFSNCSRQAFAHALFLAERHQAEIHILHVIKSHDADSYLAEYDFPNLEEYNMHLEKHAEARTEQLIKNFIIEKSSVVKVQKRSISPSAGILDYAKKNSVDLIVLGTHGRRGLGYLFLGNTAEEVARFAQCPVYTIRELKSPKPIANFNNILVPIDLSKRSREVLLYAKELCQDYEAILNILHIVEDRIHPAFYASGKSSIFDIMPQIKEKSIQLIDKMIEETIGLDSKIKIEITEGNAAREILRFTEESDIDLVLISSHGRSGLSHFMLGSVAEKVIRRSSVPVFTVKSFGKKL